MFSLAARSGQPQDPGGAGAAQEAFHPPKPSRSLQPDQRDFIPSGHLSKEWFATSLHTLALSSGAKTSPRRFFSALFSACWGSILHVPRAPVRLDKRHCTCLSTPHQFEKNLYRSLMAKPHQLDADFHTTDLRQACLVTPLATLFFEKSIGRFGNASRKKLDQKF